MKKYLTMIAGVLLLTACQNDEADDMLTGYVPSKQAISFDAATESLDNVTRASGAINTDALLQGQSIGVFASYTGKLTYENSTVTPNFMYNQKLSYASAAWGYNPLKYWPNEESDYLSFFAYAPYVASPADNENGGVIDLSDNYAVGDPWLNFRLAKYPWPKDADGTTAVTPNQVDLLYGVNKDATSANEGPWTNVTNWKTATAKDINYKVKFTMKHALASIGNAITIKTSPELNALIKSYSEVIVYAIKIEYKNLTNKARLVLNPGISGTTTYANWKELVSGELTTNRTYYNIFGTGNEMTFTGSSTDAVNIPYLSGTTTGTPAGTPNDITEGDGLFYIPLQIQGTEKATAKVTLYYRVRILASGTYLPALTDPYAEASSTFDLEMNNIEGKAQGIALTLGKDYDLMHEVWLLGGTATEPSYVRKH